MQIVKNYIYNASYQVFILLVPLITTPYISRVLGSDGVGIYAYTNSIVQYFVLLATLGVNLYGNRTIAYVRENRQKLSNTFWEIMMLKISLAAFAMVCFTVYSVSINSYKCIYWAQAIQIVGVAFDISWLYVGIEDFKKTVIRNFVVKIVSTIGIFAFVKGIDDLVLYILIIGGSTVLGNLSMWGYLKNIVSKPIIKFSLILVHFKESFILFIPQIAMQIYLVLNKTMLGIMTNVQNVGFYENSDKIVKMALTVVTSIAAVMLPRIANTYAHKKFTELKNYMYKTLDFVTFSSIMLTCILSGVSSKFSVWFMGSDFAVTGDLIAVLSLVCLPVAWSTVIGSQYLISTEQTGKFTRAVVIGAAINFISNLVLIYMFNVMGAVVATLISETTIAFIELYQVKDNLRLDQILGGVWKYLFAGLIAFFLVKLLNTVQRAGFGEFVVQSLVGLLAYSGVCFVLRTKLTSYVIGYLKGRS